MKVLIIGGVAAGTKVAAKLKREAPDAEVMIITKGKDISYAGCGLPYYVGEVISDRASLVVNTPEKFKALTGADIVTETEVINLDRGRKFVTARNEATGVESKYDYDKLVIATGASPFKPDCEGTDLKNVFYMRTPDDAVALRECVKDGSIKRAVVVGGGFIGLEVAENLADIGVKVSVIDYAPHVLPGFLDPEFSEYVENVMADNGVMAFTGVALERIEGDGKVEKVVTSKRGMKADAVILAMGIRPNTAFLQDSGLDLFKGTICVNEYLQTNDPDIYAAGDCAMVKNRITGKPAWSPMGSTANIAGRILALNIAGKKTAYPGVLGTGVAKLPGVNAGRTGLNEAAAKEAGYDVETVVVVADDKAHYYPGASNFIIKLLADKNTGKLLGVQALGTGAVDKVIDIGVTAISLGGTLEALASCDFAYAPPFSTAIHPFAHAVNVMLNKLTGEFETMTPQEFANTKAEGYKIVDASLTPSLPAYPYVDLTKIHGEVEGLKKDDKILLICAKGKRAYMTQNRMKHYGYVNTLVLEGGSTFNTIEE